MCRWRGHQICLLLSISDDHDVLIKIHNIGKYLSAANQQAKTGILAMRILARRYKRLVNDPTRHNFNLETLLRTTNLVRLSFVRAIARFRIKAEVFDSNISALEAGIGAFPRRLMVDEARLYGKKHFGGCW